MAACGAGVNANSCIAACRKFVEACDFHFFAAPAYRQFSAAGNQQTFKCGHSPSPRFSRRDLTQRRNRHSRFWLPARQASAKPGPFQSGTPCGEDRWRFFTRTARSPAACVTTARIYHVSDHTAHRRTSSEKSIALKSVNAIRWSPRRPGRSGRQIRNPNSEPHLMAACGAGVNANSCIAACRKFVEACDFHFFAAPAYRQFSAAGNQQTFKCGHSPSPRFSRRDLTQRRNRHSRFWLPARQASAKPGPFQSGTPCGEDRWFHGRPAGTSQRIAGNLLRPTLFLP